MKKTELMGILNVTPDSCFDQGKWFDSEKAIERGIEIFRQGADWLDIGGESTRPKATPVSEEEELKRILPVIKSLKREITIPISIDTMKPNVAEAAISEGARMINDVSGFKDPLMREIAAQAEVRVCLMHMQGNPMTMQDNPSYPGGIIPCLMTWFKDRIELLLSSGIKESNIILDPGIGFGKTVADNIAIIDNLQKLQLLGFPLLIGLSRKMFMGKILNKGYPELLSATLAVNTLAILRGIDIIRVHDVSEHRDVIDLMAAMHSV